MKDKNEKTDPKENHMKAWLDKNPGRRTVTVSELENISKEFDKFDLITRGN